MLGCIKHQRSLGSARALHHGSSEMYLKSIEEMEQLFTAPTLATTLEIAERCSGFKLDLNKPMLPTFPVPEGYTTESYFRYLTREGLRRRSYPSRPSRFQSFFAFGSLNHARDVRRRAKKPDASIWIVEAPGPLFRGDMNLLGAGHHPEERLRAYWDGKALDESAAIWEYLLVPPVTLVRIVEE